MKEKEVRKKMHRTEYRILLNKASIQRLGFLTKEVAEGRVGRELANKEILAFKDVLDLLLIADCKCLSLPQITKIIRDLPSKSTKKTTQKRIQFPN